MLYIDAGYSAVLCVPPFTLVAPRAPLVPVHWRMHYNLGIVDILMRAYSRHLREVGFTQCWRGG